MKTRDIVKRDPGFQYVVEEVETMSSAGRRVLLDSPFITDAEVLEQEWQRLERAVAVVSAQPAAHDYTDLRHCFMQLHDLQGTIGSLASRTVLNEVELFELKNLASLNGKARRALGQLGMDDVLPLPVLDDVFALLDPDGTGVVNFYIYDSYDLRLPPLRRELRSLQEHGGDPVRISQLLAEQAEVQQQVCVRLSDRLAIRAADLSAAMERLAYADSLFARAEMARAWGLSRPSTGVRTAYTALFNPRLRRRNEELGLRYQAVDIGLDAGVTLITGANMAGKTVLLKSVAVAQLMAQTGMFVPAAKGEVALVDDLAYSIGDEQDEMNGLSSYASEIIKISDIVRRCRTERLLVLIDEPARTTNPVEGRALVQSLVALLAGADSTSLVTTHYGGLGQGCRRLRVRGFVEDLAGVPLTPQSINSFIDYSLQEDTSDDVPHEALRIAEILGCDAELLARARQSLRADE